MPSVHAVAASAVTLITTAETVIATNVAFNESQVAGTGEGVLLTCNINATPGASTTGITLRWRVGTLTGTLIGVAQTCSVTAAVAGDLSAFELDPTLSQVGVVYVLTAQQIAATGNGMINRVVATAESANAFE